MDIPAASPPAIVAPAAPMRKSSSRATAIIRVVIIGTANEKGWDQADSAVRREIHSKDQNGRPVLLRIIDYP